MKLSLISSIELCGFVPSALKMLAEVLFKLE